jgi:mRNA interferase RelE/StbE
MKAVFYSKDAAKELRRHGKMAARMSKAITEYAAGAGAHANNVTRLLGSPYSRMRVGEYRAIFLETETTITVMKIGPRGGVYD